MEIMTVSTGVGKYTVSDSKNKTHYSVKSKRKSFSTLVTTYLYDTNGYILYSIQKTADGQKPTFEMTLNDRRFMKIQCISMYVDPCIQFEGNEDVYILKGKDWMEFMLYKNGNTIGRIKTEIQLNHLPHYRFIIEDKQFEDFMALFSVVVDMCFRADV